MKEAKISDILEKKGNKIFSVKPDTTVFESIKIMADQKIGAVLVVGDDRLLGIFTERDYMNKIILEERSSKQVQVKDVMTSKVVFITPEDSVEEGLAVMTEKQCRHLPVLDNKKLVGLVSIGDLVERIIKDQKITIKYLTEYIALSY